MEEFRFAALGSLCNEIAIASMKKRQSPPT
jgi:hypothetical protein